MTLQGKNKYWFLMIAISKVKILPQVTPSFLCDLLKAVWEMPSFRSQVHSTEFRLSYTTPRRLSVSSLIIGRHLSVSQMCVTEMRQNLSRVSLSWPDTGGTFRRFTERQHQHPNRNLSFQLLRKCYFCVHLPSHH